MKKTLLSILLTISALGMTSVYGQWTTTGTNVGLTPANINNNVVVGPAPATSTSLYLNSVANPTTILSIDNNYIYTPYPQYSSRYSGIDFNLSGTNKYKIYTSTMPVCPSGFFHISPITGPGMHMNGSVILFSDDATLCNGYANAVGKYMFDGTIGTPSINIGYTGQGSLGNPPVGYTLTTSGNSYFQNKVVIGTTSTTLPTSPHKLYVGGSIICEELVVKLQANWADYVFAPSYKLMPLSDVKTFIAANSHLPEVPSACEIEKNGVATGDMLTIQMKKIEELTLYLIQMQEQNEALTKRLDALESK
jgi:hypothetical protein